MVKNNLFCNCIFIVFHVQSFIWLPVLTCLARLTKLLYVLHSVGNSDFNLVIPLEVTFN